MEKRPKQSRVQLSKQRAQKHKRFCFIAVMLVLLGIGVFFNNLYSKTKSAVNKTYDSQNKTTIKRGEFNGRHKFAVLLMGTDTGALNRKDKFGNTDTIILAIVNPQKKQYSLVSIPRDSMAQMIGTKNFEVQKINAAYQIGGAKMSMTSVSKLINVPIKYYAIINMGGITKMVSYVNGINLRPNLSFKYDGFSFKKGQLTRLNGKAALAYSRMRYQDPLGDYGREQRQRQVITKLIQKADSVNSLTNLEPILDSVSNNVRTNLPFNALEQITVNYRSCTNTVKNDYLHGYSAMIGDAAYQIQPTKELQRVSDYCRSELGLKPEKIENNETYQNQRNIKAGFQFGSNQLQDFHIYNNYESEN